jgi:hypothetical protein
MLRRMSAVFQADFMGTPPSSFRGEAVASLRDAMASNPESRSNCSRFPRSTLRVTPGMTGASAFLDSGFARAKGACAPE